MTIRKKLEALVEREADSYIRTEFPNAMDVPHAVTFRKGAHLLLDAVVEMAEALEGAKHCNELAAEDFEKLRVMNFKNWSVHDLDTYSIVCKVALSSLEKRLSVNTEKRGEE